jgi:hypothetical protein
MRSIAATAAAERASRKQDHAERNEPEEKQSLNSQGSTIPPIIPPMLPIISTHSF